MLWSAPDKGGAGAGPGVGGGSQEQLAQWHSLAMSMHPGFLQHDWWNMDTVSSHTRHEGHSPCCAQAKMQLENGEAIGGYGRPQSSTSLSPPASGLVVPQPINPRLPNNMIGGLGVAGRKYPCKMCPQVSPRLLASWWPPPLHLDLEHGGTHQIMLCL